MRARWILAVVGLAATLGACASSSADEPPTVGAGDAYTAIVNWQVGQFGPPTTGAPLPVIYVTAEDGQTIDPGVQAKVANKTVDVAKVRFADVRNDAIDADVEGEPVKDDGVLLIVDKFDTKGASSLPIGVTVYHDADDTRHLVLVVAATDTGAEVTSSSVRPSG
jgi:hypothetical protein